MKRIFGLLIAVVMVLGFSMQAHATLTTIGTAQYGGVNYNLIYDNDSPFGSIVWLDYTRQYDGWADQVAWADSLNAAGTLTYTINPSYSVTWGGDWRLPSTVDGSLVEGYWGPESDGSYTYTVGYNLYNSEMGHLYYTELGNLGYCATDGTYPQPSWGLTNTVPFTNLQPNFYWSGMGYAEPLGDAWGFDFYNGLHCVGIEDTYAALAVRPGDVAAPIPEPATMLLLGSGLAGLGLYRKKKGRRHG